MKTIAVLGATGSVGTQALDVARARGYKVDLISADKNDILIEKLAREFSVKYVAMANGDAAKSLKARLRDTDIKVFSGESGICDAIGESSSEVVINSIIGKAGLYPTLATLSADKRLALANKESLVVAGDIVMSEAKKRNTTILPVDSEHCAIFQSLLAGRRSEVKRLILTASGGPFFGMSREELRGVTLEDTLNHPTWKMGKKITVDSATLMNKGFEVIEAAHLFGIDPERIKIVVHRESILHSAVEYIDNSIIGEFSVPDMRMCVQYAVDYPDRMESAAEPLDLIKLGKMTFADIDTEAFPLPLLAIRAKAEGGASGAVLNAADEVAAEAFLMKKIGYSDIADVVFATYERLPEAKALASLSDIVAMDGVARKIAREEVARRS